MLINKCCAMYYIEYSGTRKKTVVLPVHSCAQQNQNAITSYLKSKQLLPFGFARQCCRTLKWFLGEVGLGASAWPRLPSSGVTKQKQTWSYLRFFPEKERSLVHCNPKRMDCLRDDTLCAEQNNLIKMYFFKIKFHQFIYLDQEWLGHWGTF